MKKILIPVIFAVGGLLFAASYTNNEYQARSRRYMRQANEAFEEGDYEKAIEFSRIAEENAELSRAYITKMIARSEANTAIMRANTRIQWAEGIHADANYPAAFSAGKEELGIALDAFAKEDYDAAREAAQRVLDTLADIEETPPLPKFYVVRPWEQSRDCFWNIAGRPYVYNNSRLWEKLYQANKHALEDPADPNLIHPGMRLEIPSIAGEVRAGDYGPAARD
ncbi:MAG: hypothetical protein LBR23_05515 [Spirochaetaceae bacterium]|jgi:nucleoid-associated protein YgaU|nr:hypothetical protein [Spirochaetaceae bacterium]